MKIDLLLTKGRETAMALTKVEEAMYWIHAAIAGEAYDEIVGPAPTGPDNVVQFPGKEKA